MALSSRERRRAAAEKYQPAKVRLLLVAEAPPKAEDRYFYFEDVREQDSLFRNVCKGLFGETPDRSSKALWLARLKEEGVFLIDLIEDPIGSQEHSNFVNDLVTRCRELKPERIILIKAPVFDAAFQPLRQEGFDVSDVKVPFPAWGQLKQFEAAFASALQRHPSRIANPSGPEPSASEQINVDRINRFLQEKLAKSKGAEFTAVQAARLLQHADLLKDTESRPGRPLRNLLRAGRIQGAHQEPNGRWFIRQLPKGDES